MTIALYTTHKCGAIKSKSDLLLSFYLEFFYVTIYNYNFLNFQDSIYMFRCQNKLDIYGADQYQEGK